jgi:putative oxidoreductase
MAHLGEQLFDGIGNNGAVRSSDLALLPARASLGATMLYHGLDKVHPARRAHAADQFHQMGIRPGSFWSVATGVAETIAGVSMLAGMFTRPAALAVLVTQAVAIRKVHAPKGFAITKGGYEFNVALMAIAAGVLLAGPGRLSLHAAIERSVEPRGVRLFERIFGRRPRNAATRLLWLLG